MASQLGTKAGNRRRLASSQMKISKVTRFIMLKMDRTPGAKKMISDLDKAETLIATVAMKLK